MLLDAYKFIRRRLGGKGLSKYGFLRNFDHRIRKIVYGKQKEFIIVRGLTLYLDPKNTAYEKDIEGVETKLLDVLLMPGDVFVDVGAHMGWFSTIAAKIVGDAGKVIAFEPNDRGYLLLKKNLAKNECTNVIAEHMAVSDKKEDNVRFYTVGDLWFGSSLIDPRTDPDFWIKPNVSDLDDTMIYESNVSETSLDAYFGNQRVDFVKTDTEGNDGKVFAGMQNVIKNNPNIIIYMEFAPTLLKKFGTEPEELVDSIRKMGFRIFMTDGYSVQPFKNCAFSGNILFTRKDISEDILRLKK